MVGSQILMLLDLAHQVGQAALSTAWMGAAAAHGTLIPKSRLPAPLGRRELAQLDSEGFVAIPGWVNAEFILPLLNDAVALQSAAREGGVGTLDRGTWRADPSIRRSEVLSLSPPLATPGGDIRARLVLSHMLRILCEELNRATCAGLLQLPRLNPLMPELGYVYYPKGGCYERHKDTPDDVDCTREARREVSVLLYLDCAWDTSWGGALRIHRDEAVPSTTSTADIADAAAPPPVDVLPEGGTLVLLRSPDIAHEVLCTARPRHCVVGWLHSTAAGTSRRGDPIRMHIAHAGDDDCHADEHASERASECASERASERASESAVERASERASERAYEQSSSALDLENFRRWRDIMLASGLYESADAAERATRQFGSPARRPGLTRGGVVGGPGIRPTTRPAGRVYPWARRRSQLRWSATPGSAQVEHKPHFNMIVNRPITEPCVRTVL